MKINYYGRECDCSFIVNEYSFNLHQMTLKIEKSRIVDTPVLEVIRRSFFYFPEFKLDKNFSYIGLADTIYGQRIFEISATEKIS